MLADESGQRGRIRSNCLVPMAIKYVDISDIASSLRSGKRP
jgi:hypothetical protein